MKHFVTLLLSASAVSAHSLFQQMWVGTEDKNTTCSRVPSSNSPVTSVGGSDIRCNVGKSKGVPGVCTVAAGGSLTVEMHPQPGGERTCGKDSAIGGNHYGPVIVYMSKVADATTADGSGDWFKVVEDGLDPKDNHTTAWGTEHLNANCGKKAFTVPKSLPTGDYLVRAEVIALHAPPNPQFYMTCYQVRVTGGGSGAPGPLVKFPGAYKMSDPGLAINIHSKVDGMDYDRPASYIVPGPAVWTG